MLEVSFKQWKYLCSCDVTAEDFDLPIKGKMNLIVRFGEEYNDDNELLIPFLW
jgi:hypothetical protein